MQIDKFPPLLLQEVYLSSILQEVGSSAETQICCFKSQNRSIDIKQEASNVRSQAAHGISHSVLHLAGGDAATWVWLGDLHNLLLSTNVLSCAALGELPLPTSWLGLNHKLHQNSSTS